MEWTVQIKNKTSKIKLPTDIPVEVPFEVEIEGAKQLLRWQPSTRTLFFLEPTKQGFYIEKPILMRNLDIHCPQGESKFHAGIELTRSQTSEIHALVGRYVFGQENRDKAAQAKGAVIRSPITGKVLKVFFKEGQEVQSGDTIAIIEAMKMENKIQAPVSGKLGKISISEGGTISTGTQITSIS